MPAIQEFTPETILNPLTKAEEKNKPKQSFALGNRDFVKPPGYVPKFVRELEKTTSLLHLHPDPPKT